VKGFSRYARDVSRLCRGGHLVRAGVSALRAASCRERILHCAASVAVESLEGRQLFVASFDVTGLTQLREDQKFVDVDGSDVAVAVLDTGVYGSNPFLQPNLRAWYNAVADPVNTPLAEDGNIGQVFDVAGHGSHVAGIAASTDPNIGVAYASKIVAVKVIADPGEQQLGGNPLLRGLKWVKLHGQALNIRVVNLSLGTGVNIDAVGGALLRNEVSRAIDDLEAIGITVVAASGNSYAQHQAPGATFPAAVSTISVANTWADTGRPEDFIGPVGGQNDRYLAVEASAEPDRFASTSQRSRLPNQVAAPGQDIYSTWNGFVGDGDGFHKIQSGTSMSAPFVSGLVALMQDAAQTFGGQYFADPNRILQIIHETADTISDTDVPDNKRYDTISGDLSDLPETGLSFKRVNAYKAIQRVFDLVTAGNPGPNPGDGAEADTNSVRARATLVPTLNATRAFSFVGAVGFDGQVEVGPNDVDLFRITLQTRGSLTIRTTPRVDVGLPFDATIRLFNAAGTELARADGDPFTFDYPVLETSRSSPLDTGVYYVGISSQLNVNYNIVTGAAAADGITTGDYELAIELTNPDPNGVAQGAVDVDLTAPDEAILDPAGTGRTVTVNRYVGLLGSDQPLIGSNQRIVVDADVDMYRIVAPDDGKLEIDVQGQSRYGSDGADTYLKVYDEDLRLLGQNDDASPTNPDSRLSLNVKRGGLYYIAVTVFGNRSFNASDPYNSRTPNSTPTDKRYDLLVWMNNGDINGTALTATEVAPGATVGGAVGVDAVKVGTGNAPSCDVDWFKVVAPQDGYLRLQISGADGFVPSISVWDLDTSGRQITLIDEENTPSSTLTLRVTAGQTLHVAVTGIGNRDFNWFAVGSGTGGTVGSYTFTPSLLEAETARRLIDNSIQNHTPGSLTINQAVTGFLGRDGEVVIGSGDVDLFAFTPEADITARIRTIANAEEDADTVLRLFDARGKQIAANDNAIANGKSSRLTATLRKGQTYYIGVSGAGPGAFSYNPITGADSGDGSTGRYGLIVEPMAPGSASLTFDAKTPGVFTDASGRRVTLRLSGPGTGQLEIDGSNPDSFLLTLDDTGTETTLSVRGRTSFGDIRVNGPMRSIRAPLVTLAGDLDIDGTVNVIQLDSMTSAGRLSASLIESIRIVGSFAGQLTLPGELGSFRAGGNLSGSWQLAGGVQSVAVRDVLPGWSGQFGGAVGSIKARSYAGSIEAAQIDSLAVATSFSAGVVRTTLAGIRSISAGAVVDSVVRSAAGIDRVAIASSSGSTFFAGVDDAVTSLPDDGAAFTTTASITSFSVRKGTFADSRLAATDLGRVVLRSVAGDNGGTDFGIATTALESLTIGRQRVYVKGQDPSVQNPIGDFRLTFLPTTNSAGIEQPAT
jgi:subtilisin family serine protease